MRSSFIRFLFIAAFVGVCLFSQGKTASTQTSHKYRVILEAASGTFAGELICVGNRPGCKNENVVSVIEPAGRNAEDILLVFDFTQGGARIPVFRVRLHKGQDIKYFDGKFLTDRDWVNYGYVVTGTPVVAGTGTGRIYTITITATDTNVLEGTISLTDSNTVVRRIKLKRVKPDQVPPAPSPIMYQSR